MFRSLERAENTARLVEAGFRIALPRSTGAEAEWKSVIVTSAAQAAYEAKYDRYESESVVHFLLQDVDNPSSVLSVIKAARDNARTVRTGLTSEVWASVNETWMVLTKLLKDPIPQTELPAALATIRAQSAVVRGALHGTMLRNDIYDFCRLGTFVERMDSTARIIDVKYYSLLPAPSFVGSRLDNVQWETLLRSVSAHRSFRWAVEEDELESNPVPHLSALKIREADKKRRRQRPTSQQARELISAAIKHDWAQGKLLRKRGEPRFPQAPFLEAAYWTGNRLMEIAQATWDDWIEVKGNDGAKRWGVIVRAEGEKTNSEKWNPVPADVAARVNALRTAHEEFSSRAVGSRWLNRIIELSQGVEKVAGAGRRLDWHAFRHAFLTDLDGADVDTARRQQLAGHSSPQTTGRYTDPTRADKGRAIDKLEEYRRG